MTIAQGKKIKADDFISDYTDNNNPAVDAGKGVRLDDTGKIKEKLFSVDFIKNHTNPTNPENDNNKGVKLNGKGVISKMFQEQQPKIPAGEDLQPMDLVKLNSQNKLVKLKGEQITSSQNLTKEPTYQHGYMYTRDDIIQVIDKNYFVTLERSYNNARHSVYLYHIKSDNSIELIADFELKNGNDYSWGAKIEKIDDTHIIAQWKVRNGGSYSQYKMFVSMLEITTSSINEKDKIFVDGYGGSNNGAVSEVYNDLILLRDNIIISGYILYLSSNNKKEYITKITFDSNYNLSLGTRTNVKNFSSGDFWDTFLHKLNNNFFVLGIDTTNYPAQLFEFDTSIHLRDETNLNVKLVNKRTKSENELWVSYDNKIQILKFNLTSKNIIGITHTQTIYHINNFDIVSNKLFFTWSDNDYVYNEIWIKDDNNNFSFVVRNQNYEGDPNGPNYVMCIDIKKQVTTAYESSGHKNLVYISINGDISSDFDEMIGIVDEPINVNEIGKITSGKNVFSTQENLTIGDIFYIQSDGTLGTQQTDKKFGVAISETELLKLI